MIVCDASAVVELILATPTGRRLARRIADPDEELHAPHLLDVEVAQALRRLEARGVLATPGADRALADLADLGLILHPHGDLLSRAWALRRNLTAYDGLYVALAESLACPLLTCDGRLRAASGHKARIEFVPAAAR